MHVHLGEGLACKGCRTSAHQLIKVVATDEVGVLVLDPLYAVNPESQLTEVGPPPA